MTCATKIGYVPQKSNLFSGTIESNLLYADEERQQRNDLMKPSRLPRRASSSPTKPEGMAAEISQGGTNVSGGQKQRLSIARALVKESADLYL